MAKAKKIYSRHEQLCILEDNLNWRDPITPGNASKEGRVGIFQAYLNTDPKEFETEILPVIEDKYQEYFNIFQHPIYDDFGAEMRFRSVLGPEGFPDKADKFFKHISASNEQQSIFLHLIAEVSSFRHDIRYNIFEENPENAPLVKKQKDEVKKKKKYGKQRVNEIMQELQLQQRLKHLFCTNDFNDLSLEKISFKFKGKSPYTIKEPAALIHFIADYIRPIEQTPDLPSKQERRSRSGPDCFTTRFRNKLIVAVYDFIVKEELCETSAAKVNRQAVKLISDFLELCHLEIYSTYKKGQPALLPERLKVIENTIRRR